MMFPYSATNAKNSISPPNSNSVFVSLTIDVSLSSSIYPNSKGNKSSATVPNALISNPNAIRTAFGFR